MQTIAKLLTAKGQIDTTSALTSKKKSSGQRGSTSVKYGSSLQCTRNFLQAISMVPSEFGI